MNQLSSLGIPVDADAQTIAIGNVDGIDGGVVDRDDLSVSLSHALEVSPDPANITDGIGQWLVGDVVRGVYEVREIRPGMPFAEGGLGIVHRVWHREWEIELAVKSPKPHVISSKQGKINYENEALNWLHLKLHPHIVSCYMVRRIDDIPRLFAEYVADGSLWDWIRDGRLYRGGPDVSRSRIVDMLIQCAWGIAHAHRQNILHLDIKPANIMLSGTTVKVTDFGLAVSLARESLATDATTNNIVGLTPHYCSPEQLWLYAAISRGQAYDGAPMGVQSDIWSFAVLVLAMLMRQIPGRSGPEARETLERFVRRATPAEMAIIPRGLVELLRTCLENEPERRPTSISEVASHLLSLYRENFGMEYPRTEPESLGQNIESLNNQAASLIDLGQHREAEETFVQAEKLTPWHPLITYNKTLHAWRCAWISDAAAAETMQTLTQLQPRSADAWLALGRIQRERGDIWRSIAALELARKLDDRLDIQRTYEATSPLALSEVKVSKQFAIPKERFVNIYISDRENLLLVVPATGDLWVYGILDSTADLQLTRTEPAASSVASSVRVAISSDNQWEIRIDPESKVLSLCRVRLSVTRSSFRHVAWQMFHASAAPADSKVPWRLEALADQPGTMRASHSNDRWVVTLAEGTESISAAAVSPDGRWIVTGGYFGTVRLWEMPRGRCRRTFSSGAATPVEGLFWATSSEFVLVLRRDLHIDVIDISLLTQHAAKCRAPHILSMMTTVEHTCQLQSEVKQSVQSLEQTIQRGDVTAAMTHLTRLQSLSGWETTRRNLKCWDGVYRRATRAAPQDSVCTRSFTSTDQISAIALSANANVMVASGRDPVVLVWDFNTNTTPRVLSGHADWVRALAITPDAKFAVTGSLDETVYVWSLTTGKVVRVMPVSLAMISDLVINHRGTHVAAVSESGSVLVWNVGTNQIVYQGNARSRGTNVLRFSRDDQWLAVGGEGGRVTIIDWQQQKQVVRFSVGDAPVTAVVLTTDKTYCVAANATGQIITWDISQSVPLITQRPHRDAITAMRLFIDDEWVATTSRDRTLVITNLYRERKGKALAWHGSAMTSLALDYSGAHIATGAEDGVIRVRELYWDFQVPSPDFGRASRVIEAIVKSLGGVEIDSLARRRIYAEMAYRGFGLLDDKLIDRMIDSVCSGKNSQNQ